MEYKTIDYNKYTKEQLIKLLEISDEGAFHLRNECDALNYRLEKIKDALIEANKKIDKAIDYIHNHQPVFELSSKEQIQMWFEKEYYVELLDILNGEDNE